MEYSSICAARPVNTDLLICVRRLSAPITRPSRVSIMTQAQAGLDQVGGHGPAAVAERHGSRVLNPAVFQHRVNDVVRTDRGAQILEFL